MKKHIAFLCIALLANAIYAMELPRQQIIFINQTTGERFPFEKFFFPADALVGYGNEFYTNLTAPFMHLLSNLLSLNYFLCTGRHIHPSCLNEVKQSFQNSPLVQSYDFASWFELAYFVNFCKLSPIIKDNLLCHLAKLIRGHEVEAYQATMVVNEIITREINTITWKAIAPFYYWLFDQELEGITKEDYGYSIQQLLVLGIMEKFPSRFAKYLCDFSNSHINSLEGWQFLFSTLLPAEVRSAPYRLNLSNNNISFIPNDFLSNISPVTLNLANNKIEILPDNFLSDAYFLEQANFSNNKLKTLPTNFLSNAPKLISLDLGNNKLEILPANFLSQSSYLAHLWLHNNNLTSLPKNFLSHKLQLVLLALQNNKLNVLPNQFLSHASSLQVLSLSGNQLSFLPKSFLYECNQLQTLLIKNSDGTYPRNNLNIIAKLALTKGEAPAIEEPEISEHPAIEEPEISEPLAIEKPEMSELLVIEEPEISEHPAIEEPFLEGGEEEPLEREEPSKKRLREEESFEESQTKRQKK